MSSGHWQQGHCLIRRGRSRLCVSVRSLLRSASNQSELRPGAHRGLKKGLHGVFECVWGCSEICQSSTPHISSFSYFFYLSLHYIWFTVDLKSWGLFIYKRLKEVKNKKGYVNRGIYRHMFLLSIGKAVSVLQTIVHRIFRLFSLLPFKMF